MPVVPQGFDPFGRWFAATFTHFAANWRVWVLQGLIYFASFLVIIMVPATMICTTMIPGLIPWFLTQMRHPGVPGSPPSSLPNISPHSMVAFIGVIVCVWLVSILLATFFSVGMYRTALKQVRGEQTSVADLVSGGARMWPLLGANILCGLAMLISFALCCAPLLFVAPLFFLMVPIVVDRRRGVWASITRGVHVVTQNYWLFFLYALAMGISLYVVSLIMQMVMQLLMLISPFAFPLLYLTSIVTLPITILMVTVPYVEIFDGRIPSSTPRRWAQAPQAYLPPPYMPTPPPPADEPPLREDEL
jgi:hypothetical protein